MGFLFSIWDRIQNSLFPRMEEGLDLLMEKQREFVRVIELVGNSEAHESVSVARDWAQAGGSSGDYPGVCGEGGVDYFNCPKDK
jgi:hypothetical protein